jgi:hypothetical protein
LAAVENTKRPLADERIWRRRCMLTTEGGSVKVLMQIGWRVGFAKGFLVVFLSKHKYGSDLAVGGEISNPTIYYLGPPQRYR